MNALIFTENRPGDAARLLSELRAAGHAARYRPESAFDAGDVEPADLVFTDNTAIAAAYAERAEVYGLDELPASDDEHTGDEIQPTDPDTSDNTETL